MGAAAAPWGSPLKNRRHLGSPAETNGVRPDPRQPHRAMPHLTAATCLVVVALAGSLAAENSPPPARVEISLSVSGEIFAPSGEGSQPLREPIDVTAAFDFVEAAGDAGSGTASRRYRRATAVVRVGNRSDRITLAADARDVIVELVGTTPTPSLAASFLSRQEAELLDVPCDPILVPRLMPEGAVAKGDPWKVAADAVAGLLAIDTVSEGGIEVALIEANEGTATLELTGTVTGAVDGVATRITVKGTARAACSAADTPDTWRIAGPIDRLDVTLAEHREASWVAPGLDVEATLTMSRSAPLDDDKHRLDPPAAGRPNGHGRAGTVWHRHPNGRYTLVLDRRWRVVEDGPEGLVMRLVDRGALIAQCSILPLPRSAPDAAPTVEQVSRDVEASLADQFGHIAVADETTRDDGTRVVRVMAEGSAEERPFRWIHHLLADPAGHRSAVTFMLEPPLEERFGGADHELVAGLVLLADPVPGEPQKAADARPARRAEKPASGRGTP